MRYHYLFNIKKIQKTRFNFFILNESIIILLIMTGYREAVAVFKISYTFFMALKNFPKIFNKTKAAISGSSQTSWF